MTQLFSNNASSTLAAGITDVASSLTLATGQGALFPAITGSDWFSLTLTQSTQETSWEIVKVTGRTGDVLTVIRAQEGTAAAAWSTGAKAEVRLTAAVVADQSNLVSSGGGPTRLEASTGQLFDLVPYIAPDTLTKKTGMLPSFIPAGFEERTGAAYGNGLYIALGAQDVIKSIDGETWTSVNAYAHFDNTIDPITPGWYQLAFGAGLFLMVDWDTGGAYSSINGVEWHPVTIPNIGTAPNITFLNGKFTIVGTTTTTTGAVFQSTDTLTWTQSAITTGDWFSIAWGNGVYIIGNNNGTQGTQVLRSTDAVNWVPVTVLAPNEGVCGIVFLDGKFTVVETRGGLYTTVDGVNWNTGTPLYPPEVYVTLRKVFLLDRLLVVMSDETYGILHYSADNGITWKETEFDTPMIAQVICIAQSQAVVFSSTAAILTLSAPSSNLATGYQALRHNTTGVRNIATGNKALYSNTTGDNNVAFGDDALYSNTSGADNIAIGVATLYWNIGGNCNTANGGLALYSNTEGSDNTAIGIVALYSNTIGSGNVANGYFALYTNTIGDHNTATGTEALYSNSGGGYNVANGSKTLRSNTTGRNNVATGASALYYNSTGYKNTANGFESLYYNTTGSENVANGAGALHSNTTGIYNTATGVDALYFNTTGKANTAYGYTALFSNTTGIYNTATGYRALYTNTTGSNNVAIGASALYSNTTGDYNTATGVDALYFNTTGCDNIATGYTALFSNQTGQGNVAIGKAALSSNTTGQCNTAIGSGALSANTTGAGNTAISPVDSSGTNAPVFSPTTQNDRFCMGSTSVTNAYIQVAWTVVSDARDKTDFAPVPHGLDFVTKLKPIAFRYKMDRGATEGHGPVRYGFKAQDVLALEGNTPVIVDAEDADKLRFNDQSMLAVLVNAIQELKAEFDAYKASHP